MGQSGAAQGSQRDQLRAQQASRVPVRVALGHAVLAAAHRLCQQPATTRRVLRLHVLREQQQQQQQRQQCERLSPRQAQDRHRHRGPRFQERRRPLLDSRQVQVSQVF